MTAMAIRNPQFIVSLAIGLIISVRTDSARAQQGAALVDVAPVVEREVLAGQTFVGTVVPVRTSIVGSPVGGRVVDFAVNEGDRVTAGQTLCQLRTTTLELQLAVAQAQLALNQQELAELENGSRPEEIEQARARMEAAQALMRYRQARLKRLRRLFEEGRAISEDELEEIVSLSAQAEQSFLELKAAWELTVQGPRQERIAQARARVAAQEEEVRRLKDEIDKYTIRAPFNGYVVTEHTEVGAWVNQGGPIVDLAELDHVDVEVPVPEDQVRYLAVGTSARVEIGALPQESFTGQIVTIVPQANVRARTFPVKVRLANRQVGGSVLLKAGMFARVMLPVGQRESGLLVSKDALVLGGPRPIVYVLEASPQDSGQGRVRPVPVDLGVAEGGMIQVKGELQSGDLVVVRGNERLRPGQEVIVAQRLSSQGGPPSIVLPAVAEPQGGISLQEPTRKQSLHRLTN